MNDGILIIIYKSCKTNMSILLYIHIKVQWYIYII